VGVKLWAVSQHLAHAGLRRRFRRVQMAGRRVQAQAVGRIFFHQQKTAVTFDDCGHGDIGFPSIGHGGHYHQRAVTGLSQLSDNL
jgi:hypothetical protein